VLNRNVIPTGTAIAPSPAVTFDVSGRTRMKALSLAVPALALAALVAPPLAEAGQRHGSRESSRRSYTYGRSYRPMHRHAPGCGHYAYRYSRPAPYAYDRYYGYYPAPYGYGYGYGYYPPPPPPRHYRRPRVGVGIYLRF
jgi:hypothetical protein